MEHPGAPPDQVIRPAADPATTSGPRDGGTPRARRWRLLGLGLWLLAAVPLCHAAIGVGQWHDNDFGGTFTALNLPAPKVWAVPLIQRSIGYRPGPLGSSTTAWVLVNALAIWLITVPAAQQHTPWRLPARWLSLAGTGVLLGVLLHAGSIRTDWSSQTMLFATVALGIELIGSVLVYLHLANEAQALGRPNLGVGLRIGAVLAAAVIALAVPVVFLAEYFQDHADNLPVQLWGSVYGLISIVGAAWLTGAVLGLVPPLWRFGFALIEPPGDAEADSAPRLCAECGYDRRGTATDATCPECGSRATVDTRVRPSTAKTVWARYVGAGLLAWLVLTPPLAYVVLHIDYLSTLAGNLPLLNFPGPKVWGVPAVQRAVGSAPAALGVGGVVKVLLNVAALWLITWPRPGEGSSGTGRRLRVAARWVSAVGVGAFLGLTMVDHHLAVYEPGFWKWGFTALLVAELPGTVLVYLYLGQLAGRFGRTPLVFTARTVAVLAATLIALAICVMPLGEPWRDLNESLWLKALAGLYGGVCLAAGLAGAALVVQMLGPVGRRACRGWRWRRLVVFR